jgi:hypothetical protein
MAGDEPFGSDLDFGIDDQSFASQVRMVAFRWGWSYDRFGPNQRTDKAIIRRRLEARDGSQRAIVKACAITHGASSEGLRAHLRYLQRDGVSASGDRGAIYDSRCDRANCDDFLLDAAGDYRHVRLVVSIEQGPYIGDLRPIVREVMRQAALDLFLPIEWIAADHYNTGHPHSHIVLRARNDRGELQSISTVYLRQGLRRRVRQIVTRELGPNESDRVVRAERILCQCGPVAMDRSILRGLERAEWSSADLALSNRQERTHQIARLKTLTRLGVAKEIRSGTFRLSPHLGATLEEMTKRHHLYASLAAELRSAGITKAPAELTLFRCGFEQKSVIGRIISVRSIGYGRDFLVVDGIDGRANYVPVGCLAQEDCALTEGMIVRVTPNTISLGSRTDGQTARITTFDQRIANFQKHPSHALAGASLAQAGQRQGDAASIRGDRPMALSRLLRAESAKSLHLNIQIEVLSFDPLETLITRAGATWLDRFALESADSLRSTGKDTERGFRGDVRRAIRARTEFLLAQGLLREGELVADRYDNLRRQEMKRICQRLCDKLDREFVTVHPPCRFRGRYREMISLASERLAVIELNNRFTIVPWCRAIEQTRGRAITIVMRHDRNLHVAVDRGRERKF